MRVTRRIPVAENNPEFLALVSGFLGDLDEVEVIGARDLNTRSPRRPVRCRSRGTHVRMGVHVTAWTLAPVHRVHAVGIALCNRAYVPAGRG
jgi:hypothetical protein